MKKSYDRKAFFKWIDSLGIDTKVEMPLHNYGDGRKYNKSEKTKVCSIVSGWRKHILQITWDLKVIPCCLRLFHAV